MQVQRLHLSGFSAGHSDINLAQQRKGIGKEKYDYQVMLIKGLPEWSVGPPMYLIL